MKTGSDVRISQHSIITHPELVTMASHVAIDPFCVITTALEVGHYVHIAPHCSIIGGPKSKLILEDFSGIAAGSRIICASDDYTGEAIVCPFIPEEFRSVQYTTVRLCRFVTLGTNVVVHPGITIGEGTIVGSGSLVTKNLEPWGIYVGSPARRIKTRPKDKILKDAEEIMRRVAQSEGQPSSRSETT